MAELLRPENFDDETESVLRGDNSLYVPDYEVANMHALASDHDPARLEAVLSLQSFVMSRIYPSAKRTRLKSTSDEKRRGFAILNESIHSHETAYDGSRESYMAYLVGKYNHNSWSMRLRFRSNELTKEAKTKSALEDYLFAWTRDEVLTAAAFDGHVVVAHPDRTNDIHHSLRPVSNAEVLELPERVHGHAASAGALNPRSWYHTGLRRVS